MARSDTSDGLGFDCAAFCLLALAVAPGAFCAVAGQIEPHVSKFIVRHGRLEPPMPRVQPRHPGDVKQEPFDSVLARVSAMEALVILDLLRRLLREVRAACVQHFQVHQCRGAVPGGSDLRRVPAVFWEEHLPRFPGKASDSIIEITRRYRATTTVGPSSSFMPASSTSVYLYA